MYFLPFNDFQINASFLVVLIPEWKRAGPISQRSEDRNLALLPLLNTNKHLLVINTALFKTVVITHWLNYVDVVAITLMTSQYKNIGNVTLTY